MKHPVGSGFVGEIEGLGLVDLVQFACLAGDDRKLSVLSEDNRGVLYFADNEIIHAEFGELTGEEAFYRIMSWPSGTFSMLFASTNVRTIDSSWNFLLLEAARRIDEQYKSKMPVDEESLLPKVLVVDDSRFFTKAFIKLFEEQINAQVVGTATNGREALKFLEMQVPDLVTLDMTMPVMNGDVALKHIMIRSPAPVVLVSNFNDQHYSRMMDFMRYGCVDIVAKPTSPESWNLIGERMQYILLNVKEFCVDNVSRAKKLKQVDPETKKQPWKKADKLLLILGGLGGMLELQKIIPALHYDSDTAVLVLQNMYPGIVQFLSAYLDNFTPYTTTNLLKTNKLLGGQCLVGNCHGKREIVFSDSIPVLSGPESNDGIQLINPDGLLRSAADTFGSALTVLFLSGVEQNMQEGMEAVVTHGGKIILQDPDSCLLPRSIEEIRALGMEECSLKPEEIAPYISGIT
ncbi:two-component system, chemotaxis family, response regulator CheB [Candidatus Electrothrix marina]|uniref:protein-glutamate methylesterase n=2 Tax=Candidatus Electrothrix marina TaxID=1859130 RepID=A0A3S3RCD0_9BACT|nr:two-component system, chemotaxis family, response regulator CheB [Candidatus Electrothrix marina]